MEPTVLAGLIEDAASGYLDGERWRAAVEAEREHRGLLSDCAERWGEVTELLRNGG